MTVDIVGPTQESKAQLRAEFAMSSKDWSKKAAEAAVRGDHNAARVFEIVARVADSVARGGQS